MPIKSCETSVALPLQAPAHAHQEFVATRKGAWRPHWQALVDHLQGSVPADWTVLVLADRGLDARWLFHCIVKRG